METTQIISWLYDKAARAHDHSYARMLNTTAKLVRDLDEKQRWIPVTERLPDEETDVLVARRYRGYRYVEVGKIKNGGEVFCYSDEYKINRKEHILTHWMPLPEPPKEEDHG